MSPQQEVRTGRGGNHKEANLFFSNMKRKKKTYNVSKKLSPNAQGTPACPNRQNTQTFCVFLSVVNSVLAEEGRSIKCPEMHICQTRGRGAWAGGRVRLLKACIQRPTWNFVGMITRSIYCTHARHWACTIFFNHYSHFINKDTKVKRSLFICPGALI